ncbi:MAG: pilus assembly protein PilM [Kiritimatiellaeota bacterium]|nr:pilus assembly protein PilM [Kiritimatiellota bacterium]
MIGLKNNSERKRRVPNEVLGLDLGASGIKVVRLRRNADGVSLLGADLLPPLDPAAERLTLPAKLLTNYAAVTFSNSRQAVRLVNVAAAGEPLAIKLQEAVKVEADQRLAFTVLRTIPGKRETQVLTVALPEADVQQVLALLASGPPAAWSVEHAGLAALTAFYRGPGRDHDEEALCFIEVGAQTTFVAFLNKGAPVLIRTLELGGEKLIASLQSQWGLDRETALGTLGQGATIDISQPIHDLAAPFLRQLSISRDFVERQESCRIARVYLAGGLSQIKQWTQEIQETMGVTAQGWDPFTLLAPTALPPAVDSQRSRFASAIGAALSVFEDS